MRISKIFITTLFILLLPFAIANATANQFEEGKDFLLLAKQVNHKNIKPGKVTITEFFSYGCPMCYRLESELVKWKKTQTNNIELQRVPVVFHRNWDVLAKAYYVAEALDMVDQINPVLFDALHNENRKLYSNEDMAQFFIEKGADKNNVKQAFSASPSIDAKVRLGDKLMKSYHVYAVPSIIINGKYKVDMQMVRGDIPRLFAVLDSLIQKEKQQVKR